MTTPTGEPLPSPPSDVDQSHGESNYGKSTAAWIARAAAIAVAVINTVNAKKIADLQDEIARQYLRIAQYWRNYYNETFAPCEDTEIAEACDPDEYVKNYDRTAGQMMTSIRAKFREAEEKSVVCSSRYCTGLRGAMLKDAAMAEAQALGNAAIMARMYEDAKYDMRDDLWWKRLEAALNRGRDLVARNAAYSQMAYGMFGDLGKQAAEGAAGAMYWLGYDPNRIPTVYPQSTEAPDLGATRQRERTQYIVRGEPDQVAQAGRTLPRNRG